MLADNAVIVPSDATDRLGAAAREAGAYLVIGINEREPNGEHDLQHAALLRPRRVRCSASTAS